MRRWLISIRLLLRRLFNERPARSLELENIALRARINWLRKAIESERVHVMDRVPRPVIAEELNWILEQDARVAGFNQESTEVLNERTA